MSLDKQMTTRQLILVPQYYFPTQGGLQNFTYRLSNELAKRGIEITLPYPGELAGVATAYPHHRNIGLVPLRCSRDQLWDRATELIARHDFVPGTPLLVVGIDYEEFIDRQMRFIVKCVSRGLEVTLRVATSGDVKSLIATSESRRSALANCKQLIATNEAIVKEIAHFLGTAIRTVFLPNPIELDRYGRRSDNARREFRHRLGLPPTASIALWTGRLERRKRLDDLLEAWSRARTGGFLLIQGIEFEPGNPLYDELRDLQIRLKIADCRLLAASSILDMPDVYGSADLFVFPSDREGFPNSLLEAAASDLRITAYDIPGVGEILAKCSNESYRIVPLRDVAQLAEAIRSLSFAGEPDGPVLVDKDAFSPGVVGDLYEQVLYAS